MLKDTILTVQTCDLKVDINCDGCVKEIKKILHKIDGVYQSNVNRQEGKVTVTGLMDMDTVFKKLKKAGMSAQLWDASSAAVNNHQKLQLGGNDMGDQLKDASGKGLLQGEASSSAARSGGGTNDATIVLPQLTPTPEQQQHPNIQQQIEKRLQMLNGENLLPNLIGMPPAINRCGMQSGKKIGGGTRVLVSGNANNDNKKDVGMKLYQDAGGNQVKNGGIGQLTHNSALGSLNNHNQAKKDISVGVGSQMMGGSMALQKGGMMRPSNNMIGPANFPNMGQMGGMSMGPYTHMGSYNVQSSYGGGAVHGLGIPANRFPGDGYYPSGAGSSRSEMMQQVARNPMLQQPYMMEQHQQEHEMKMNAHCSHSQNAHYGPGCTGYQLMGYDNGLGHLQQQYPPPMYYPMPLPPQHDNFISDENPSICSPM